MKKLVVLFSIVSSLLANAQTGTIELTVYGLHSQEGNIVAYLFNASTYPDEDDALQTSISAVQDGTTVHFNEVPAGTYAIIVCHDENSNKKLDSNFFGMPTEYIGLSNNVFGSMGWPKFKEVSFEVINGKTANLSVTVRRASHF